MYWYFDRMVVLEQHLAKHGGLRWQITLDQQRVERATVRDNAYLRDVLLDWQRWRSPADDFVPMMRCVGGVSEGGGGQCCWLARVPTSAVGINASMACMCAPSPAAHWLSLGVWRHAGRVCVACLRVRPAAASQLAPLLCSPAYNSRSSRLRLRAASVSSSPRGTMSKSPSDAELSTSNLPAGIGESCGRHPEVPESSRSCWDPASADFRHLRS